MAVAGFDGHERQECTHCDGFGGFEWVEPDLSGLETVADVETFLGAVPAGSIFVDHPGMSKQFFDDAIRRAHNVGITITFTPNGTAYVESASDNAMTYLVTRYTCSCRGHLSVGRCYHRALWIFMTDVVGTPVAEPIAA